MADGNAPNETDRQRVFKRVGHMEQERQLFEPLWMELRNNFLPTRGKFQGEQNNTRQPRRNGLPNSTPLYASRTLASGLHAGLTSPARPWFKMSLRQDELAEFGPVKVWLAQAEERLRQAFSGSNFYEMLPFMYGEYGTFGTMCGLCIEDDAKPHIPFRFEWYTAGQYYLATNEFGRHDTMCRDYQMTVRQLVGRFGQDRISATVKAAWTAGSYEQKFWVRHTIEPARDGTGWASCYWEKNLPGEGLGLLARRAIAENPIIAATWERMYGETYGTNCPGMVALGDAKALQIDEISKARGIDRHHNPPLQGPPLTTRAGISLLPGAYNEIPAMASGPTAGIRSVYDFKPDISGLLDNIRRGEGRIEQAYYTDLFLMLTMDDRNQRATAEEIRARYDEKVLALGPTLEQCNSMLRGVIDRGMEIMIRRSRPIWEGKLDGEPLLPPPPEELMDQEIDVEFVSTLHQALRATTLQGIERFAAFAGQMAQMTGAPPDKFDVEQALDEYAHGLGVVPTVIRSDDAVAELQAQRAQAQQAQQMAQMAKPLKDGADAVSALSSTAPVEGNIMESLAAGMTRAAL